MYKIIVLTVAAVSAATSRCNLRTPAPIVVTPVIADNEACLYREENFQGEKKCFNSQIDLCDEVHGGCWGDWNDRVRSVRLGKNAQIKVYRDYNYQHLYGTLSADAAKLQWTDATSFIKLKNFVNEVPAVEAAAPPAEPVIADNEACLYREENFQGEKKCFNSQIDLCDEVHGGCWGDWNDRVRSVRLGKNAQIKVYRDYNYQHLYGTLSADVAKLQWTDATSFKF